MWRWALCFGVALALLWVAGAGAWAAGGPVIQRVDVDRIWTDGQDSGLVAVRVQAPGGAASLTSVTITAPNGDASLIAPGAAGNRAWVVESDTVVRAEWRGGLALSGTYTVTAAAGELEDSLTFSPPPEVSTSSVLSLSEEAYDATTVTWTGATDAGAENTLYLYKQAKQLSWQYSVPGAATSVAYNADGLASEGALVRGHTYLWRFESRKTQEAGVTDSRVFTYTLSRRRGRFVVLSSIPTIHHVTIARWYNSMAANWCGLMEEVHVAAYDLEGGSDITEVTVTDPTGVTRTLDPGCLGDDYCYRISADTAGPAVAGVYTISVTDAEGNSSSLATPVIGAPPAVRLTSPAPDGVVTEALPTLAWEADPGPSPSLALAITREESDTEINWTYVPADAGLRSTGYNHDGSASLSELVPGYSYRLGVAAGSGDMEDCADVRVTAWVSNNASFRFTFPSAGVTLPDLPGKLVHGSSSATSGGPGYGSLLQYDPDSSRRAWLGPVRANDPAWSPDGTKLMYDLNGPWVDSLDGSYPAPIGSYLTSDARWSPDGSRVVYVAVVNIEPGGVASSAICTANPDGSGVQTVAGAEEEVLQRHTTWSPDGAWIGYWRTARQYFTDSWRADSPSPPTIHLVRPEGSDDHEVPITGVGGYPGYEANCLGPYDWAPDAQRLVVGFYAYDTSGGGGLSFSGLGVLPVGGGAVQPIFTVPGGYVCCAAPRRPTWSPDGTQIVFSSGHHLPINDDWSSGWAEPGVELWLINADGSGDPLRLTYNHSVDAGVSWWAPVTFTDVPKGNWAYCAVSTCYQAGIVQGYADGYHPADSVTRAQMAVFLSRALAGGDAYVPTGVAVATFADVPTDYWASRYVEYLADPSRGVVQGYWDGYHPEELVNRAQMAVFVARSIADPLGEAGLAGYTPPATATFADVPTDFWAFRHVEYLTDASRGIVKGYWDGYHPDEVVTRDQVAVYVARAFELPM